MDNRSYNFLQLDALKELANIGGGNAANSISQLINEPVSMTIPTIEVLNYSEVFDKIMDEDSMVNAVVMKMVGGSSEGMFLFITSDEVSKSLVKMMLPQGFEISEELGESAIKELVNILVTSYLNAISTIIDEGIMSSVPILIRDMFGAILSSVYIESEQFDDNIMIIKNEFSYNGDRIESSLFFVPKPGVLGQLFKILGVGEES